MPLNTGDILQGNYRIVSFLSKGGMGRVYLAEHTRLAKRRFAIKENVPGPSLNPGDLAQLRQQFYNEASTLASLDHPNLPKVSDYFTDGDNEYLVMDYVEGQDLHEVLNQHLNSQKGPLPEGQVLVWADQSLDALEYLHSRQPFAVVHRDVKPSNIILTPRGNVKLVDFGLSKLMDPTQLQTATAMRGMGTPEYTPLEQYPGSVMHTDARTDIFAFGATLYHLLTGRPPASVRDRLLNVDALQPLRQLNPSVSASTEKAILKALEIHPDQRFQTAREMRLMLAQELPSVPPPPPSGAERRSTFWLLPLAILVAIVLAAGIGYWAWQTYGPPASPPPPIAVVETGAVASPIIEVQEPTSTMVTGDTPAPPTPVPSDTPAPTSTPQPTDTATRTSAALWSRLNEHTSTPQPTNTATRTPTPTATRTPTPAPQRTPMAFAIGDTNLRAGPGTNYAVVGQIGPGETLQITGRNQDGTWWQVRTPGDTEGWIIANRVETSGPIDDVALIPTPTQAPTPTPSRPNLVYDFESPLSWRIGDQQYGQLTSSSDTVYRGDSAGRLSYDFPAVPDNFVVFLAQPPVSLSGTPTGIQAWVHGDGSGHFLNAWIQDSAGEVRSYTFGQIQHQGWQQKIAWFAEDLGWPNGHISGPDNGQLDYPVRFYALVLDGVPDGQSSSGTIYLDEVTITQQAIPESAPTRAPTPTATGSARLSQPPGTLAMIRVGSMLGVGALLGLWLVHGESGTGSRRKRR
jgi:serine/threonine-protein kinase